MKKIFSMMLLIVALVLTGVQVPVQAQAASGKTAVIKKADAVTKDLTKYANYRGWEVTAKVKKKSSKQVTKALTVETASGTYFKYDQVTKKVGKKYKTYFKVGKTKYKLTSVKSSIKKYSSNATIKSFLKARAEKSANSLASYAKARNWNVSSKVKATSTKKGVATVNFSNKRYKFSATVTVKRSKTPKAVYLRKEKASTAKAIKEWLETYKDEDAASGTSTPDTPDASGTTTPDAPDNNPGATDAPGSSTETPVPPTSTDKPDENKDAVTAEQLNQLTTAAVNELTAAGKANGWTVETSGYANPSGIGKMSIAFDNADWKFQATVESVSVNGKAETLYTLEGGTSDKATILSWLTKYAVAATPAPPTETPAPSVSQAELIALAKTKATELTSLAQARNWTVAKSGEGTTNVTLKFSNAEWDFSASVGAVDNKGKAEVVYKVAEGTSSLESILSTLDKYKVSATPAPPTTPAPPATTAPTAVPQETLRSTNIAAANEVLVEALKQGWSQEELVNTGTKIQYKFTNSAYTLKVTIETIDLNSKATVVYIMETTNVATVTKELVLEWLKTYKVSAPNTPTNNGNGSSSGSGSGSSGSGSGTGNNTPSGSTSGGSGSSGTTGNSGNTSSGNNTPSGSVTPPDNSGTGSGGNSSGGNSSGGSSAGNAGAGATPTPVPSVPNGQVKDPDAGEAQDVRPPK